MLTLADVIEALTNIRPAEANLVITEAAVDSRQVIPGGLFVALPGERVDGHDFVAEAFQRGASFALIQHDVSGAISRPLNCIPIRRRHLSPRDGYAPLCLMVENTLAALQQIARFWRRKLEREGDRHHRQRGQIHHQRSGRRSAQPALPHSEKPRQHE